MRQNEIIAENVQVFWIIKESGFVERTIPKLAQIHL
jgi:hypothetical protein